MSPAAGNAQSVLVVITGRNLKHDKALVSAFSDDSDGGEERDGDRDEVDIDADADETETDTTADATAAVSVQSLGEGLDRGLGLGLGRSERPAPAQDAVSDSRQKTAEPAPSRARKQKAAERVKKFDGVDSDLSNEFSPSTNERLNHKSSAAGESELHAPGREGQEQIVTPPKRKPRKAKGSTKKGQGSSVENPTQLDQPLADRDEISATGPTSGPTGGPTGGHGGQQYSRAEAASAGAVKAATLNNRDNESTSDSTRGSGSSNSSSSSRSSSSPGSRSGINKSWSSSKSKRSEGDAYRLSAEIQEMLIENFFPPIASSTVPGNPGRLYLQIPTQ